MDYRRDVVKLSDGEVKLWIEQGSSIHIKAVTKHGDPVELNEGEADELGETLIEMARLLRDEM
ncbi:MAG: hypothetical protein ABSG86_13020 [Thermoguttaceae bacterium]|jgi:hypothetical protein